MGNTILEEINEKFSSAPKDITSYSPLALAFIGDAVYELVVRTLVVEDGNVSPKKLQQKATMYEKAVTQSKLADIIQDELTEDEKEIFRRGKNSSPHTKAKNASLQDYLKATGFEAVIGYLYLKGENERMLTLIKSSFDQLKIDSNS